MTPKEKQPETTVNHPKASWPSSCSVRNPESGPSRKRTAHTYVRTYIHTYIHTHTHTYTHIHIHTYIYIDIRCEVIIWSKFGLFNYYCLAQVRVIVVSSGCPIIWQFSKNSVFETKGCKMFFF